MVFLCGCHPMKLSLFFLILLIFCSAKVESFLFGATPLVRATHRHLTVTASHKPHLLNIQNGPIQHRIQPHSIFPTILRAKSNDDSLNIDDEDALEEENNKPSYQDEDWELSDDAMESYEDEDDLSSSEGEDDEVKTDSDDSNVNVEPKSTSRRKLLNDDIDIQTFNFPSAKDLEGFEVDENGIAWPMPENALELDDPDSEDAVPIFMVLYLLHKELKDVNLKDVMEEHMKYARGHSRWKHSEFIEVEDGMGVGMMFTGYDMNDINDTHEAIKQFVEYDPLMMNQLIWTWNKMQLYPLPKDLPPLDGKTDSVDLDQLMMQQSP